MIACFHPMVCYMVNTEYEFFLYTLRHCVHLSISVASAPTNLTAVQDGPTSIAISWSPPTPLGDTTGYRIFYTGANSSGSMTVSATDNSFFSDASGTGPMESDLTDNYTLAGLHNGDTYSIYVVALSEHFPSDTVMLDSNVPLCKLMCYIAPFPGSSACTLKACTLNVKAWSGRLACHSHFTVP